MTLSATLHCKGQVILTGMETFTMIFASDKQVYVGKSHKLNEAIKLKDFDRKITSLAVHNNHLFVSLVRSDKWFSSDSSIWRSNITYSKNFTIDPKSWDKIVLAKNVGDDITCMVGAEEHIYAGLTDGEILKCSAKEKDNCEIWKKSDESHITGMDYNSGNSYVTMYTNGDGYLYRYSLIKGSNRAGEFRKKYFSEFSALKVEFDAVWLGTRDSFRYVKMVSFGTRDFKKHVDNAQFDFQDRPMKTPL